MPNTLGFSLPLVKWPSGEEVLINTWQEICIYEAIDRPFMTGYITLLDTAIASRTFVGGEQITFEFHSPFEEGEFRQTFTVFGKTNEPISERGVRAVKLLFTSEEALAASTKRYCRLWDKPIPSIVDDIIQDLPLSQQPAGLKQFFKDDTQVNFKYVAPNKTAEDIIHTLLGVCFDDQGYPFVMFENNSGIHFKSLKTLLEDYNDDEIFIYDNLLQIQALPTISAQQRALTLESLQVNRNFDLLSLLRRGAFNTRVVGYDMINRRPVDVDYDIQSRSPYDGNLSHEQFDQQTTEKYLDRSMGERIFIPVAEDSFMETLAQHLPFKRAVANLASSIKVEFEQFNALYFHRTGDCISMQFDNQLSRVGTNNQGNELGQAMSGRYLVTKIAHKFSLVNTITYDKAIEAVKLGYGEPV